MTRKSSIAALCLIAFTLGGCGILFPSAKDRAAKNTPNFKSGYSDGCASATQQGSDYGGNDMVRDEALYEKDRDYRLGWGSGFYNCRTNTSHSAVQPGVGPIPDNNPGSHPY